MEREILFRGFDNVKNEWVYGDLIHLSNGYAIRKLEDDIMTYTRVDSNSVGQYTTRKDGKGNKIFEGDIISLGDPNIKYLTMWRNDGFCAKQIGASSYIGLTYWASDIEVLGNVIDNPEMVKGGCNEA